MIAHEMRDKGIPALSIALVDSQRVIWARGFGWADSAKGVRATAETVYRVGSVSKLFTDLAVMQLVERDELSLDADIKRYIPGFAPRNPYGKALTLRQLMSHRSGLVREPPAGHYFDTSGTSLGATLRSLNRTALVFPPESTNKYSNAGIAVVGYALERVRGEPFATYVKRSVLDPIGMRRSAFEPTPGVREHLSRAQMWTLHGRTFDAPTFELGMAPAGSMYASVLERRSFVRCCAAAKDWCGERRSTRCGRHSTRQGARDPVSGWASQSPRVMGSASLGTVGRSMVSRPSSWSCPMHGSASLSRRRRTLRTWSPVASR